jgi:hypothetical protein
VADGLLSSSDEGRAVASSRHDSRRRSCVLRLDSAPV